MAGTVVAGVEMTYRDNLTAALARADSLAKPGEKTPLDDAQQLENTLCQTLVALLVQSPEQWERRGRYLHFGRDYSAGFLLMPHFWTYRVSVWPDGTFGAYAVMFGSNKVVVSDRQLYNAVKNHGRRLATRAAVQLRQELTAVQLRQELLARAEEAQRRNT